MSLYHSLGGPCKPLTNAVTSNYKFLPPVDPVYYKKYTYMYKYPGSEKNFVTVKSDVLDGHPIQIKNFFGKIGVKSTQYPTTDQPVRTNYHKNVNPSRCPGCC